MELGHLSDQTYETAEVFITGLLVGEHHLERLQFTVRVLNVCLKLLWDQVLGRTTNAE